MHDALDAGRPLRNIERGAIHDWLIRHPLGAIPGSAVVVTNSPRRIVRRSGDHANLVAALGEPGRHFSGVLSDAREFRSVVKSVDQNSQTCLSSAAMPCIKSYGMPRINSL